MATAELPPLMTAPGLFANQTICYPTTMVTTNGVWAGENPVLFFLPEFLIQNLILLLITRLLLLLLKPFHTTQFVCEILCGLIFGQSGTGNTYVSLIYIFQRKSQVMLEVMGNIGIIYYLFIVGLGMDLSVVRKHSKKAMIFAGAGILPPFLIACLFSFPLYKLTVISQPIFILLFTSALSITSLPVLARTLGEFRLLGVEIGEFAKSTALINEIFGVALLVLAITFAEVPLSPYLTWFSIILSAATFIVLSLLVVRPVMTWLFADYR